MAGYRLARIAAAHSAALVAPAAPIANVATGTPAGICTMDNSESSPPRDFDCTGTPSTGRMVLAAVMPGRCAAPPAPAISTSSPRARAPEAYSNNRSEERRVGKECRSGWSPYHEEKKTKDKEQAR